MLTIREWHEIFKLVFIVALVTLTGLSILYKYAEVSYKKAYKNTNKTNKRVQSKTGIVYNIADTSKIYLFEVKQAKKTNEKGVDCKCLS